MRDRIKTLLLYANGFGWKTVLVDTALRGLLRIKADLEDLPAGLQKHALARKLLGQRYEILSYVNDWRDAFCEAPELDVEICNINNLVHYFHCLKVITQYELIVILHSAAGDNMSVLLRTVSWFQRRRGKLLIFIGNEYNLMPQKIGFIKAVEADYVGSQLPLEAARWLYAACERTQILAAPHALNPKAYYPDLCAQRTIDIGFVGDFYPYYIGDIERTKMIQYFQAKGAELGLRCDIRNRRMPRSQWACFLNSCRGIIGAESGTYYLERDGKTIAAVIAYLKAHPTASFDGIFERFFKSYPNPISGKAISSRHFEPMGTKTCQILLEGHYNGILMADEHYIALKKDLSNSKDVVARFKDESYRRAMVERAYDYVLTEHTYQHRVRSLLRAMMSR